MLIGAKPAFTHDSPHCGGIPHPHIHPETGIIERDYTYVGLCGPLYGALHKKYMQLRNVGFKDLVIKSLNEELIVLQ